MTPTDIKAEPLGVWDVRNLTFWEPWMGEANAWAQQHITDANSTYRVEFYLLDAPFAVIYRYARNEDDHPYTDPATGDTARAEPVVQMLDELPPAHLLGR